jgi:hypothetical protein
MPIAFPAPQRGWKLQAKNLTKAPPGYVVAPNMGNPGVLFSADTLDGGQGKVKLRPSIGNPGVNFAKTFALWNIDTRAQHLEDAALWKEEDGTLNMQMSGVTRDSTGAILGNCRIFIFRTEDRSLVRELIADASGNWSTSMMVGGPFFIVAYHSAEPLAGTTVDTLTPVQV